MPPWRFWVSCARSLGESVSSFELISRPTVDLLLAGVPGHTDPMGGPSLVRADRGHGPGRAGLAGRAAWRRCSADAVERGIAADAVLAASGEQAKKLWKMREDMPFGVQAAGGAIPHDVSVPLSRITEFIRARRCRHAGSLSDRRGSAASATSAMAICTTIRFGPSIGATSRFAAERGNVNKIVHDIVVDLGGSISAEHGIGLVRLEENLRYKSPVEIGPDAPHQACARSRQYPQPWQVDHRLMLQRRH